MDTPTDNKDKKTRLVENKLNINQWALEDRPREKLVRLGAAALSNAELFAILIGSGSPHETAVGLMQRILTDSNNSLKTLGRKSIEELEEYNGVGLAKAVTIIAACELSKRRQGEKVEEHPKVNSASDIYNIMQEKFKDSSVEEAHLLLMNNCLRLIKTVLISRGGLTETAVDVRVIMREAVLANATAIALCHNHPSGNTQPSGNDDRITQLLKEACTTMRITFIDHVIITDGSYFSYSDMARL